MAKNVTVQVIGGTPKTIEAKTVADAAAAVGAQTGYTAMVNGEAAQMTDCLSEYSFVSLAPAVKGGSAN